MQLDNLDPNQVAGSAIGAIPERETSPTNMGDAIAAHSREFNSNDDIINSSKYPDTDTYYYARGGLSIGPLGSFIIGPQDKKPTAGVINADAGGSQLTSTATRTTLGSPQIDTLDGHESNPLSTLIPSSHMTPVRGWPPTLIPKFSSQEIILIGLSLLALGTNVQDRQKLTQSIKNQIRNNKDRFLSR